MMESSLTSTPATWGLTRAGSLAVKSFTQAPGRQQISLWSGSGLYIGPSAHLRMESPTTMTLLGFFIELVLLPGLEWPGLGWPSSSSFFDSFSLSFSASFTSSRAPYLLWRDTMEGEGGQERIFLPPWAGTCFQYPPSLRYPPSAW